MVLPISARDLEVASGYARRRRPTPREQEPLAPGGGPAMARNSVRLYLLAGATFVLSSVLPTLASAQTVSFTASEITVGANPGSIAVGDFNGDGNQDLAVANPNASSVSVLLGNGDGTFPAAQRLDAGTGPFSIAVGDFNRDRVPDLAVAHQDSNSVSVLLGNGDGTFQAAQSFDVGTAPVAIAVGEFNAPVPRGLAMRRKEAQDLVVTNSGSDSISVLTNSTPRGATRGLAPPFD